MRTSSQYTYQLVVELKEFKPRIWRRFLVSADLPLAELGYAVVAMFEGTASHLFHFWFPKNYELYYTCARCESAEDLGFGPANYKEIDAGKVSISKVLPDIGSVINFECDFGDSWNFKIKLEKILEGNSELKVLNGAGYGIIEDCGGIGGLDRIVELCTSKSGREYEEFVAWSGLAEFDISAFDCDSLNRVLNDEVAAIKESYEDYES